MLQLNPAVQFYPFDDAKGLYSCVLQSGDDSFRCVLPRRFIQVLQSFDGKKTPEQAISTCAGNAPPEEQSKILFLVQGYFVQNHVLIDTNAVHPAPAVNRRQPGSPMSRLYFRIPILRGAMVKSLVLALSPLFDRRAVIPLLIGVGAVHIYFYSHAARLHAEIGALAGMDFLIVVVTTLLSAIFHELGHATALVRNGGKTVEIGFGIYIMFPVFYANVSECWTFPRGKRLQVNVGGLYFQALTLIAWFIWNMVRPSVGLSFSFLWIDLLMIRNLNPFLRMDGYWVLADLIGEPSLHRSAAAELKHILTLFTKRGRSTFSTTRIRPALILYCLATAVIFVVVYYRFAILVVSGLIPKLPGQIHALILAANHLELFRLMSILFSLLWQLMMIYVFVNTLAGFFRQYLPRIKERWRTLHRGGSSETWLKDNPNGSVSHKMRI